MSDSVSRARLAWRRWWLAGLYALLALVVAAQRYTLNKHNVYLILRTSFFNLLHHVNLYAQHPAAHVDFFRYSPTFALAFGPLAVLPIWLGVALWCLINFFALYVAVHRLLPEKQARLVLILVLGDLIRSMQSTQSNALIVALMIAAFLSYERDHPWRGAWAVMAGAAIKIFPAGAGLFALLRPGRRRALLALAVAGAVLVLLPLPITGPHLLLQQYRWWLGNEQGELYKSMYSVMDLLDAWTGVYWRRWPIQAAGLALTLLPVVLRRDAWAAPDFRRRVLCSLLCFSVLFNHGAEAPSFVISTAGIAIWYATGPRDVQHGVLLILTLLLVTAATSDVVPDLWRARVLEPGRIKVLPVLAAWIAMQVELLRFGRASGGAKVDQGQIAPGQSLA
jgi:Glycosyltransferase family 87